MPTATRRADWLAMTGLLAVALLLRLAVWLARPGTWGVDIDAYLEIARNISAGAGFAKDQPVHLTAYRPPLYPYLLSGVLSVTGSFYWMGALQSLWGTWTVWCTARSGQLLGLGRWGLLAGLLVAVDPLLLQYTALPMTETLCASLVATWCWLRFEWPAESSATFPGQLLRELGQALVLGLLCLSRPTFLATAGLWIVIRLVAVIWHKDQARRLFVAWVVLVIGFTLTILPWTVRNYFVTGRATPATTHGGYTLLLANNPVFYREVVQQPWGTVWQGESLNRWQQDLESQMAAEQIQPADEVSRDEWSRKLAQRNISQQPLAFGQACLWRAVRFWDIAPWGPPGTHGRWIVWCVAAFYGAIHLAAGWGLLGWLLERGAAKWAWLPTLVVIVPLFAAHLVFWTDMRMRAPLVGLVALWAARALHRACRRPAMA